MTPLAAVIRTKEVLNPGAKSRLLINLEYWPLLAGAGLVTFADFFHYRGGELVKRIADRTVTRITLGQGVSLYLKRHLLEVYPPWQQAWLGVRAGADRHSEGANEFHHYCQFRQRGLATAVPVAMGEREVAGGWESFLLTLNFSPLLSLEEIIRYSPHLLAGPENAARRRHVLSAAAGYARRMHQSGLNHLDFNATHILLPCPGDQDDDLQVAVFDLQRVASNPLAAWRWPVKTLAELNFTLPGELFSDGERRGMLADYLGKERLAGPDLLLWRAIRAKTDKIARHTRKRWARRRREREATGREMVGPRHLLIHDRERGDGEPVTLVQVLRRVPGSREVGAGLWRARPVIVKAFQSPGRGQRHLDREWQGLVALRARGIAAPLPLLRGQDSLGRPVMVVERIGQAVAAADLPALQDPGPAGASGRDLLMRTLASQHQKGVEQRDLHLGNFLLQEGGRCWVIDPAEMRFAGRPLGRSKSLTQVATLGALLPAVTPDEFKGLALAYARARQWRLSPETVNRLERRRQAVIAAKIDKRLKKYGRRNTRHEEVVGKHYRLLFDRRVGWECREPDELAAVLREATHGSQAGQAFVFTWRGRQLAAYRIAAGGLVDRLWGRIQPQGNQALKVWQDLYRRQATAVQSPTPLGLLQPRSPWPGLASFVIIIERS